MGGLTLTGGKQETERSSENKRHETKNSKPLLANPPHRGRGGKKMEKAEKGSHLDKATNREFENTC